MLIATNSLLTLTINTFNCFLKAILEITTMATLTVLAQTQPCQLWNITGRHEGLGFLCWYTKRIRLTVGIKASRTCLFTKSVWCHMQTSPDDCINTFKVSNVAKSIYMHITHNINCKQFLALCIAKWNIPSHFNYVFYI